MVRGLVEYYKIGFSDEYRTQSRACFLAAGEGIGLPVKILFGKTEAFEDSYNLGSECVSAFQIELCPEPFVSVTDLRNIVSVFHCGFQVSEILFRFQKIAPYGEHFLKNRPASGEGSFLCEISDLSIFFKSDQPCVWFRYAGNDL